VYIDPNSLTPAQQIFAIFYAIFFGIMLQTVGARRSNPQQLNKEYESRDITLNLFDTPNAWAIGLRLDNRPFWRFLFSLGLLNLLPGIIFVFFFNGLSDLKYKVEGIQILVIIWLSLLPHYVYRVYLAFLVLSRDQLYLKKGEFEGYNTHDILAYGLIESDRVQHKAHGKFWNHIAFPILFVLPSVIILYDHFLVPGQIWLTVILTSYILLLLFVAFFMANRN